MNEEQKPVSDEMLNAFVDDELDATEKARLLELMAADATLRGRVCQLWQVKEMVRGAWPAVAPSPPKVRPPSRFQRYSQALAASLVLTLGALVGWMAHEEKSHPQTSGVQLDARKMDEGKVILHLASNDPDRFQAALDEAEELSRSRDRMGRPVRVELLANAGGINLVRAGGSPHAERIAALQKAYRNLSFTACANAIEQMRLNGVDVRLLPEVHVAPTALDQIMMRLQQGWTYIQV